MDVSIPDKAHYRIGEVSRILGVEPYVVRYWESEFKTIKPGRTTADHRLYRRKDLEELMIIRDLLYQDHFTIRGAKQELSKRKSYDREHQRLAAIKVGLQQIRSLLS
ncbi:MAG: MerR family transcriptional regulator [Syntrophales bacterium]|nr:MerR family transcriptional regulator [Syntrophales bacterium]